MGEGSNLNPPPPNPSPADPDKLAKILASLSDEDSAILRMVLVRKDETVDANCVILAKLAEDFRVSLLRLSAELDTLRRTEQSRAADCDAEQAQPSDAKLAIRTKLTVSDVSSPLIEGLSKSLELAGSAARQHLDDAAVVVASATESVRAGAAETSRIMTDAALRGYFVLFGLPAVIANEIDVRYNTLSPTEKVIVSNIALGVAGNTLYEVLKIAIAASWAILS